MEEVKKIIYIFFKSMQKSLTALLHVRAGMDIFGYEWTQKISCDSIRMGYTLQKRKLLDK
jgi:hypothetical protein